MITFRSANPSDEAAIARLHAQSWQKHYRGIFSDDYLDREVVQERAAVWADRFANPQANRHIIVAENGDVLCGFACIEANEDPTFGSLLDNLHVSSEVQGQGIGVQLIQRAAQWAESAEPNCGFYLWVLEDNHSARKFYEAMGAINQETVPHENPGGNTSMVCRYIWKECGEVYKR